MLVRRPVVQLLVTVAKFLAFFHVKHHLTLTETVGSSSGVKTCEDVMLGSLKSYMTYLLLMSAPPQAMLSAPSLSLRTKEASQGWASVS